MKHIKRTVDGIVFFGAMAGVSLVAASLSQLLICYWNKRDTYLTAGAIFFIVMAYFVGCVIEMIKETKP